MTNIPKLTRSLQKLIRQFVDKGYKRGNSKFRKLTSSIQNNCSTNENVMISNVYHYQKHNRVLPNLQDTLTKQWHILQANESCKKAFSPLIAIIGFRKDTSLKQIIGTKTIHSNKKIIKTKNNDHTGKFVPCNSKCCLCCQQFTSTKTFKSN